MKAKKVFCPNSFLDDYSHKGYLIKIDEENKYCSVVDALTFEWSAFLEHKYINDVEPIIYQLPYYKPVEANFRNVTEGREWIFNFPILFKEEFLIAAYFFEFFVAYTLSNDKNTYHYFQLALERTTKKFKNKYKNEILTLFSEKVYDFFIKEFGISFIFNS
jgi:hypothetical protein